MKIRYIILLLAAMAGAQLLRAEGPSRKALSLHHGFTPAGGCFESPDATPAFETWNDCIRREPEKRHTVVRVRFRGASSTALPLLWKEVPATSPPCQLITSIRRQNNRLLLPSYYHFLYRLTLF